MKTRYIILSLLFVLVSFISFAAPATHTDTIRVYGNCGMCKNRIEKAAAEAGAVTATWDEDTKLLVVTYDDAATTSRKIQEKVAAVGHDTQDVAAPDATYSKLPGCCKYERKGSKASAAHNHEASANCCKDGCDKTAKEGCCKKDMSCCSKEEAKKADCCKDGKCKKA
ncbi:cation transporter [Foetidibacter luteolus]|uniref:cation transporter n=1 Tax=Foetidibacter luteolus TaxID=2608880 RepID=UPI00129A43D9|nr:cation transporter [Foetidibacter luteolus]